jgi:hypothetical protein
MLIGKSIEQIQQRAQKVDSQEGQVYLDSRETVVAREVQIWKVSLRLIIMIKCFQKESTI